MKKILTCLSVLLLLPMLGSILVAQNPPVTPSVESVKLMPISGGRSNDWIEYLIDIDTTPTGSGGDFDWTATIDGTSGARLESTSGSHGDRVKILLGDESLADTLRVTVKDDGGSAVFYRNWPVNVSIEQGNDRSENTDTTCLSCDKCEDEAGEAGTSSAGLESLFYQLNIGAGNFGAAAYVMIRAEAYHSGLYDPSSLVYVGNRTKSEGFDVGETSGVLDWVLTPTTFMEIDDSPTDGYNIEIFDRDDVTVSATPPTTGSATPIIKVKVYKNGTDKLRIDDDSSGGSGLCRLYEYSSGTETWELWEGSSSQLTDSTTMKKTTLDVSLSGYVKTSTKSVSEWNGSTLVDKYKEERTIDLSKGGVETQIEVDPSGESYVTDKIYYSGTLAGRVQMITYPDGYWEYFVYYGSGTHQGKIRKIYSPFENTAVPTGSPPSEPSTTGTRLIEYTYQSTTRVKKETKLNGYVVEREWIDYTVGGSTVTIERQVAQGLTYSGSASVWDTASNLVTIITRNKTTNRITKIEHPDGQEAHYSYNGATYNTSTRAPSGRNYDGGYFSDEPSLLVTIEEGDHGPTVLLHGVKTEIEYNELGHVLEQKRTSRYPSKTDRLFYHAQAQDDDAFKRIIETSMEHMGRTTYRDYDCCGLSFEVDERGMAKDYTLDRLGRITNRKTGVTNGSHTGLASTIEDLDYEYDAMGRQLKVIRNEVTTDSGTPDTITIEENTYNVAGELEATEDALGNETQYLDDVGNRRKYVSRPSMGSPSGYPTEYTEYYRDGRVKETRTYASSSRLSLTAITGSMIEWLEYDYTPSAGELEEKITSAGSAGTSTTRWTKTVFNLIGNVAEVKRPRGNGSGTSVSETYEYGKSSGTSKGRLIEEVDADGVTTRFAYNDIGEVEQVAVDRDTGATASINFSSDRIVETERYWVSESSEIKERTITRIYTGSSTTKDIGIVDRHRNGWKTWTTDARGQETISELVVASDGNWTVTTTHPDGSKSKSKTTSGLPDYQSLETNTGGIMQKHTITAFDGHKRVESVTDYRFGVTTYAYNNRDDITSETRPNPTGSGTVTYSFGYDSNRNPTTITHPGTGGTTTTDYYANGLLKKRSGTATPTLEYTYTSYGGKVDTLKTLYGSGSSSAISEWNYDSYRNWVSSKEDPNSDGASYEYTAGGRLSKRTWDRGTVTDYAYTDAGELELVNYSDSTPDVLYSYNRTGTVYDVKDGTSSGGSISSPRFTYTYTYLTNYPLVLSYERLNGLHTEVKYLRRKFDGGVTNRPGGYQLGTLFNADQDMELTYSYVSNDGRLYQVTSESNESATDTYTYTYGSAGQLAPTLLSGTKMYTTLSYMGDVETLDYIRNRTSSGGSDVSKYDYDHNNLGLRTKKTMTGSAFSSSTYDSYAYNTRHQLTQGKRYTTGGSPITGKDYQYSYDNIGNRLDWYDGYNDTAHKTTYTPTSRNQYSSITGDHAVSPITYDSDGNLTDQGTRDFIYNGENQLIEVEDSGSSTATFKYDYLGRRVEKSTSSKTETYVYDGWNLIAVYDDDGANDEPLITYTWGLDLSETVHGAGGVGGLLMSYERSGSAWTYFQDGHGNVSQVISQSTGSTTVAMEYDPYGNVISGSPGTGLRDAFRFSSKFYDTETDLYYYGYRYLDSEHGRWLNRDPIGEEGGFNLYGFVGSDPVNTWDYLGLDPPASLQSKVKPSSHPSFKAVHEGAVKALKDARAEFEKLKAQAMANNKPVEPAPREYGGRVCEHCDEATGEKTYYLTMTAGFWASEARKFGAHGMVNPQKADPCKEGDKEIALWHTHPGSPLGGGREGYGSGGWFSDGDIASGYRGKDGKMYGPMMNPKRLPIFMTRAFRNLSGEIFETFMYNVAQGKYYEYSPKKK